MTDASKSQSGRNLRMTEPRVFRLDAKRWDTFVAALGKPPKDPNLRKLLARKPKWKA